MLRIHFTPEDLARTQIAPLPDPMWEIVMSLQALRARYGRPVFDGWRRASRNAIRRAGIDAQVQALCTLAPLAGYFPDYPSLPPVLVYRIDHEPDPAFARSRDGTALDALLGASRAAVLRATVDGATTGDLARRCGISPASASRHATLLRDAGLVSSRREANQVIHTTTALGNALLQQNRARSTTD